MRLLPEGKSKALSILALGCAAAAAVMSALAVRDLLTLLSVFGSPAFYLGLVHATLPVEMPPLAGLIVRHARPFFAFLVLFWVSALTLSLGTWARREWARRGAAAMLYLLAGAALLLLLYPWLAVPRPLMYEGVSIAPEFNATVKAAAFAARAAAFAGGGICLWWALALDRGELKGEFH
jgi:hypothetical protein